MRGTLKEAPENPPVRMETITLRQTSQSADRQTALGGNGQRGSGSNLLSFSKLKKERQKNSDLRNFSNFKVPWRNTIPRMAGFKLTVTE